MDSKAHEDARQHICETAPENLTTVQRSCSPEVKRTHSAAFERETDKWGHNWRSIRQVIDLL